MCKFDFNGRNYKVVNGLVHEIEVSCLAPCYKEDNVLLNAYAEQLGYQLYQKPCGSIHSHGHQTGKRGFTAGRLTGHEYNNPVKELDVFLATDQPETCRKCGARTEFDDFLNSSKQLHKCKACGYSYITEEDYKSEKEIVQTRLINWSEKCREGIKIGDFSQYGAGYLIEVREIYGEVTYDDILECLHEEHVAIFFIPAGYNRVKISEYVEEWYHSDQYTIPFEIWVKEKWSVTGVTEVKISQVFV
jgi:hypothetical protein